MSQNSTFTHLVEDAEGVRPSVNFYPRPNYCSNHPSQLLSEDAEGFRGSISVRAPTIPTRFVVEINKSAFLIISSLPKFAVAIFTTVLNFR